MKRFCAWILALFLALALPGGEGCASRRAPAPAEGEAPRLDFGLGPDFQGGTIHGLDFDVIHLASPKHKSSISVYVGFNPTLRSQGQKAGGLTREAGQIGGVPVEWTRWHEGAYFHSEALARGLYAAYGRGPQGPQGDGKSAEPGDASGLIVHIFITAQEAGEVARLEAAGAKLKLEPGREK